MLFNPKYQAGSETMSTWIFGGIPDGFSVLHKYVCST